MSIWTSAFFWYVTQLSGKLVLHCFDLPKDSRVRTSPAASGAGVARGPSAFSSCVAPPHHTKRLKLNTHENLNVCCHRRVSPLEQETPYQTGINACASIWISALVPGSTLHSRSLYCTALTQELGLPPLPLGPEWPEGLLLSHPARHTKHKHLWTTGMFAVKER